jgi:hypothetical protein
MLILSVTYIYASSSFKRLLYQPLKRHLCGPIILASVAMTVTHCNANTRYEFIKKVWYPSGTSQF